MNEDCNLQIIEQSQISLLTIVDFESLVPQENLFLFAGILVIFTLIPLFFASKAYKNRIKEKQD
jgi:hypothetical protein